MFFFSNSESFKDACSSQISESYNASFLAFQVSPQMTRSLLQNKIYRHVKMFVSTSGLFFQNVNMVSDDASSIYLCID